MHRPRTSRPLLFERAPRLDPLRARIAGGLASQAPAILARSTTAGTLSAVWVDQELASRACRLSSVPVVPVAVLVPPGPYEAPSDNADPYR